MPHRRTVSPIPRGHGATIIHAPDSLLTTVAQPKQAERTTDHLARWIPRHAWTHDAVRDAWTVVAPFDHTTEEGGAA